MEPILFRNKRVNGATFAAIKFVLDIAFALKKSESISSLAFNPAVNA